MSEDASVSCSKCSVVWQNKGTTNCWSGDPLQAPPKPGNCPSDEYAEVLEKSFNEYREIAKTRRSPS